MTKTISLKNILIGEGIPKICVPMVGKTLPDLIEEASYLQSLNIDLVEWRVDFFELVENVDEVVAALNDIRIILREMPLIFTFRSMKEGGEREISLDYYFALNRTIVETGLVDLIDIELFNEESQMKGLVKHAHENNVFVIISNHDFDKTPDKEEIISRLRRAQELGGDIPKIAVMPKKVADVITLLDATTTMTEQFADRPIITMSMAGKGVISRMTGELFGSSITFASAKKASAPGQIAVEDLKDVMNLLHNNL